MPQKSKNQENSKLVLKYDIESSRRNSTLSKKQKINTQKQEA